MKLDTILVPLDGSTLAESALAKATELCQSTGARLWLIRAAEAHRLPGGDPTEAQVEVVAEAEKYLGQVAERLRAQGMGKVETSVWYGPPAHAIVEGARLYRADLIVMTTHGRSGLGRLILGSVAESVLRGTTTPILLLRAAGAPLAPLTGAGEPAGSGRPAGGPGARS
jgi:nucleotide-binding universal stress UspA family protein